jgi:hypothetical protein
VKHLKVITASPGLSGAGLIFDYLLDRNDFISPFKNYPDKDQQSEFRFITDPGGLNSLYNGFYKNFSVNNCAYVYDEFNKYLNKISKLTIVENNKKKKLYNNYFFSEIEKFKKKIIKSSYYGLPQFHRLGLNKKDKLVWKITNRFRSAQQSKFLQMVLPVDEKIFINESKKFVDKVLYLHVNNIRKNIVIDQGANFWKPELSTIFYSNKKIILITRDPRSIFASMKLRKSLSYPGHNINIFIDWYQSIISRIRSFKNSKNILLIKYENFIINHDSESKKLLKFLKIKKINKNRFNIDDSRKNIYKADKVLTKKEKHLIETKLKKYLQWPKKKSI